MADVKRRHVSVFIRDHPWPTLFCSPGIDPREVLPGSASSTERLMR